LVIRAPRLSEPQRKFSTLKEPKHAKAWQTEKIAIIDGYIIGKKALKVVESK